MNPHKIKVTVKEIQEIGTGVYSVLFDIERKYCRFKAGQFLHLTLDPFDPTMGFWPESRVFSICSPPKTGEIGIVYSVKGQYTKRMEKELAVGKDVWIKLPYGEFIIPTIAQNASRVVLVAGGTGVSPFIPFLMDERSLSGFENIDLYFGLRSRDLDLFQKDLVSIQSSHSNIHLQFFYEQEEGPPEAGRLSIDKVYRPEYAQENSVFFLSGPPAMLEYFKTELQAKGITENNIHTDDWE